MLTTLGGLSWKIEVRPQWPFGPQLTSGPHLMATRASQQPISDPTLTAIPWRVFWKMKVRSQWPLEAQPTLVPHPSGYSSQSNSLYRVLPWRLTLGSLLKDGGSLTMTARSSAYIGSSPWWLPGPVNSVYRVLSWRLPLGESPKR